MSEMQNGTMMTHPLIQEVGTVVHPDDHSAVQVHSTMLNATNREIQEMKERMGKMEEKFDIIYELASSIKVLSTQMLNINDNVRDMKKEFSQDIKDIKHEQQSISEKVDKIEVESSGSSEKNSDKERTKKKIATELLISVLDKLVLIVLFIILLALFPHLSDIIMGS